MGILGEIVFIFVADYIEQERSTLCAYFVLSYVSVAFLQVSTPTQFVFFFSMQTRHVVDW